MVKLDSSTFYFIFFCSQTGLSLQQWLLPPAVCTESSTVLHFPRLLQGAVICTWCDSISVPFLYFVCVCFSMISCVLSTGDRDFIHPPAWAFYNDNNTSPSSQYQICWYILDLFFSITLCCWIIVIQWLPNATEYHCPLPFPVDKFHFRADILIIKWVTLHLVLLSSIFRLYSIIDSVFLILNLLILCSMRAITQLAIIARCHQETSTLCPRVPHLAEFLSDLKLYSGALLKNYIVRLYI